VDILAAATDAGVFDLQNMGSFSARGLCLFMESSGNASIDSERLTIMLDTAKQLAENLDTYLLDDERIPWSHSSLSRYQRLLGITSEETVCFD
jgi:cell division protein ZipA